MTPYRVAGTTQAVDENGNNVNYSGNLDSLSAIAPSSLRPSTPIQAVTPPVDNTNYAGITGNVTDSIIGDYADLNKKLEDAQTNQDSTGTGIIDIMKELTGKTADTAAANESAGVNSATKEVNDYASQLADLNGQAKSLNREAQAIPIQTQLNNRGRGVTEAGAAPQTADALRVNALKALSIGQQSDIAAAGLTGSSIRLQAAKDKAQQIIDLKYKPLEDDLAIKKQQYDLNKDVLSAIDKKRTESLGLALTKEATDLAAKKANAKEASDLAFTLQQNGAPMSIVQAALKAESKGEVQKIPGVSNYLMSKADKLDLAIKNANLKKLSIENKQSAKGKIVSINGKDYLQNPDGTFSNPVLPNKTISTSGDPLSQLTSFINSSNIKDNAKLQDVSGVVAAVNQLANENPDGTFPGLGIIRPGKYLIGAKGTTNQSTIEAINLKVQQWASGAALTEAQTKQVAKITPTVSDTDKVVKQKINALSKFMLGQAQGLFASEGIDFKPSDYDYFAPKPEADVNSYLDTVESALQSNPNTYLNAGYDTK